MLHEILLSLSGHPSVLFDATHRPQHVTPTVSRLLSPPEAELLSSIGKLSRLHRKTRDHVSTIAAAHPSTICRAVATSIGSRHLDAFQRSILNVEARILKQDASTVGAYNIVPLAGIASEFAGWVRLMDWLWELSNFMLTSKISNKDQAEDHHRSSGAKLIDKLRSEVQTGYPDIEDAAGQLSQVAEAAWLRQLSSWLLHGRLPSFGASDFFIQPLDDDTDEVTFCIHHSLLPKFVTRHTASSTLFIGKSIQQARQMPARNISNSAAAAMPALRLLSAHVHTLSQIGTPVASAELSEAVTNIRVSWSRNLLQYLLPRKMIVETLSILHQFFLLGRGEFAVTLIAQADANMLRRLRAPTTSTKDLLASGLLPKEAEVTQILGRSMSILSTLAGEDDHTDDLLEVARRLLRLHTHSPQSTRPGTPGRAKDPENILPQIINSSFDELLLSVPTSLTMDIHSPRDLFITKSDLNVYSLIHGYLLAIRRAHLRLTQLWRHSSIRREHPSPPGYVHSNSVHGRLILSSRRERSAKRARTMRTIWATCRAAIFFLAEIEAYFHGSVIQQSFKQLLAWVTKSELGASTGPSYEAAHRLSSSERSEVDSNIKDHQQQYDPEALAHAHRQFISSVSYGLLLTDVVFVKALRAFCSHVDELVAYVTQIIGVQQNLDLEEDEGIEDFSRNLKKEEQDMKIELDRARRRLDGDLKGLVERLRDLDNERVGASKDTQLGTLVNEHISFEPCRVEGIDRLLMKLDWSSEGKDIETSQYLDIV